jgi:hypothetical protein
MENSESGFKSGNRYHRWLEVAVPLLSFGGALIAILLWTLSVQTDLRITILGCVLASWVLAYLAWIRPKKDIVALTTPIYSFVFLAVPTDNFSVIILELLYAASLSILLLRLKYRFSAPPAIPDKEKLSGALKTYTERTHDILTGTPPDTAHQATRSFVQFAQGEYAEAARISGDVTGHDTNRNPVLTRAFAVVLEHATVLDQSLARPEPFLTFRPEDADLLALPIPSALDRDQEFYAALDNALLLLFSTGWNASEQDRPHLLTNQAFAQKLIGSESSL